MARVHVRLRAGAPWWLGCRPCRPACPRDPEGALPRLVAGVGNPWSGDLDLGPRFVRRYRGHGWPADVVLEELTVAAQRVLHRLWELRPAALVVVAGFPRGDHPGTVRRYRPSCDTTDEADLQRRLGESAAGVIDLDHILAVTSYFGALPADTVVIEVEPAQTVFSERLSATVSARLPDLLALVDGEVRRRAPARQLRGHACDRPGLQDGGL